MWENRQSGSMSGRDPEGSLRFYLPEMGDRMAAGIEHPRGQEFHQAVEAGVGLSRTKTGDHVIPAGDFRIHGAHLPTLSDHGPVVQENIGGDRWCVGSSADLHIGQFMERKTAKSTSKLPVKPLGWQIASMSQT